MSCTSIHELQLDTPPNSVDRAEESGSLSSSSPPQSNEDSNSSSESDGLTDEEMTATLDQDSRQTEDVRPTSSSSVEDEPHSSVLSPASSEESGRTIPPTEPHSSTVPKKQESSAPSRREVPFKDCDNEAFYYVVGSDAETESESFDEEDSPGAESNGKNKSPINSFWIPSLRNRIAEKVSYGKEAEEAEILVPSSGKKCLVDYLSDSEEEALMILEENIPSVEAYVEVHTSEMDEENTTSVTEGWTPTVNTQLLDHRRSPNSLWQEPYTATAFYGSDPVDVNLVVTHGKSEDLASVIPTPDVSPQPSYSTTTQLNMETMNDGEQELHSSYSGVAGKDLMELGEGLFVAED